MPLQTDTIHCLQQVRAVASALAGLVAQSAPPLCVVLAVAGFAVLAVVTPLVGALLGAGVGGLAALLATPLIATGALRT